MRILDAATQPEAVRELLARDVFAGSEEQARDAARIVAEVRARGDEALVELTQRFDSPALTAAGLRVPTAALEAAREA
ncbi:MAG: histidinol dehydrogenase, partial [Armatimonadetes bacterium]|nr:histidinol dehydrogenase [Armatimonadota bacterium]